jgi:hypothetical protein
MSGSQPGFSAETMKSWWAMLRLYNPLQPFFDKTWRPGEIESI